MYNVASHCIFPLTGTPLQAAITLLNHSIRSLGRTPTSEFNTPAMSMSGRGSFTTPIRDKLNINAEDGLENGDTPYAARALKESLRSGLSRLPAPRNDYEIVVPEDQTVETPTINTVVMEDQADVDARALAEQKAKR